MVIVKKEALTFAYIINLEQKNLHKIYEAAFSFEILFEPDRERNWKRKYRLSFIYSYKQKRKRIGGESNAEFTFWKAMIPFKFEVRKEWSIETGHDL